MYASAESAAESIVNRHLEMAGLCSRWGEDMAGRPAAELSAAPDAAVVARLVPIITENRPPFDIGLIIGGVQIDQRRQSSLRTAPVE